MELLDNQTADGSGAWQRHGGGPVYFEVQGTLDGASVALEVTRNGGTTVHKVASLGAVDIIAVDLPTCQVRATVSGSGGSTNVSARV